MVRALGRFVRGPIKRLEQQACASVERHEAGSTSRVLLFYTLRLLATL